MSVRIKNVYDIGFTLKFSNFSWWKGWGIQYSMSVPNDYYLLIINYNLDNYLYKFINRNIWMK